MEKKRVLLIGNHWETQMMATCALEGAGYDAVPLFDRRHIMQAIRDVQPDLILLDMSLPKLSARQVLRTLRRDTKTQKVPIIGIVPQNDQREMTALPGGGLADVFARPIDHRSLIRKVRKVLLDDRYRQD